jgi:hypothetical protein
MTTSDDAILSMTQEDIQGVLENNELSDEDKVVALMELPDPTMDEEKARDILEIFNRSNQS